MIISEEMLLNLLSDDGHVGTIAYKKTYSKKSRREGTIDLCKSTYIENVIHIGCCGHLDNIKKQLQTSTHFHQMLVQNFKKVIGFDINEAAVKELKSLSDMDNIFLKDIFTAPEEEIRGIIKKTFGEEPYIVLLPEVLEHTHNPVEFLRFITKTYVRETDKIIISVPNAYGFGHICEALFFNRESINLDHKYMFTPTTILKVMCGAGIIPEEIHFLDLYKYSKLFKKPFCGNTILTIGSRNEEDL